MKEIITKDFNSSGLEEKINIAEPVKEGEYNEFSQFFMDKKQQDLILDTIKNKSFTISELKLLISEIKIEELRTGFENYIEIVRECEIKIINYLKINGLLDSNKKDQVIKLNFIGLNFKGIDEKLLFFLENYNLNKGVFLNELNEVQDAEAEYSFIIYIGKQKKEFYIKNMKISEKK